MAFNIKNLSTFSFVSLVTIINIVIYNFPFYKFVLTNIDISSIGGVLTFCSTVICLYVLTSFLLFLIALISPKVLKIFSMIMMIMNSIAIYFILTYHVLIDKAMMGNVFNTDIGEVTSYYSPKIFLYVFVLGVIPAYAISKLCIQGSKRLHLAMHACSILLIGLFLMYLNAQTWLWMDKNCKYIGGLTMPWSYSVNAVRYQIKELEKNKKQELLPDAKFTNNKKNVIVLVIGESARSANYALNGYNKPTNPYLSKLNVTALQGATSSATYTTASVNSILSPTGSTSGDNEPLPSYLQRQGVDVFWRSNNGGEPSMKIKSYQRAGDLKKDCTGDSCEYDEALLTNLDQEIKNGQKNKTLIILHITGSHGPTYYKKYPPQFEMFKPVCTSVDMKQCSEQELMNAYDNSLIHTDYFLSKIIEDLKNNDKIPSLFIYISDHGESLGEHGVYLHGTPYAIAPDFQKHVPFILWMSPSFTKENTLKNMDREGGYNQKEIFQTIMGALGMTSSIYNKDMDIFQRSK